ncbi:DUF2242 domain-containing protein [Xanthomonas maliensis]|uniref:DUF2242 domain-containing protein n=1 Tax=Xanthomonas maliensis TaxID=1321368 RepID=UPI0003A75205|nr:DUF2242 domain-containing protein [Xanthomonas maliensis]KAB7767830.1 DUF2242 domain-containing protein [Xanthomonas maliensis]
MSRTPLIAHSALLAVVATLAGCGGSKGDTMLMRESFNSDDTYSRTVAASSAQACEAARRVLLSQGYVVARADASGVEGSKNFQLKDEQGEQLNLRISCASQDGGKALVFISALQDRYALKKSSTNASVGVGVLGSLSLPVGSSDDSLVRVSSTTVQDAAFYKRFFERLGAYLPKASDGPQAKGDSGAKDASAHAASAARSAPSAPPAASADATPAPATSQQNAAPAPTDTPAPTQQDKPTSAAEPETAAAPQAPIATETAGRP